LTASPETSANRFRRSLASIGDNTVTRTERLTEYLTLVVGTADGISAIVTETLAIADDRRLMSLGDVSKRIGRPPTTIKSWLRPAQATGRQTRRVAPGFPAPAYEPASGGLWDAEDIEEWIAEHPDQVRTS
jgi:hypothetical protein